MKLPKNLKIEEIIQAVEDSHTGLDNPGFCLSCGERADSVEPDARNYECDNCGSNMVFGAEEIIMMGVGV
jgi:predicted RNA-binding Zn-ribbon protein involved in translation (DUF1610 family)